MENSGIEAIVQAVNIIKADMGAVVIAGVGIAMIGLGAIAAFVLVKRFLEFGGDPGAPENNYPDY